MAPKKLSTVRDARGYTLLEMMTVVAILGILATLAYPRIVHILDVQQTKASAQQVATLLKNARSNAVTEGTPHLVYFETPTVNADGSCSALAVEVRDADHSYSITAGDVSHEFHLDAAGCEKVAPVAADPNGTGDLAQVPLPTDDLAARAPDVAVVASSGSAAASANANGGSNGTGSNNSGPGSASSSGQGSGNVNSQGSALGVGTGNGVAVGQTRSATVAETVVNGATFPVDAADGRPVIAFSEQGVAVDPANPTAWGSGAGGVYLTDGASTVVGAVVTPLGDVKLRVFDSATGTWN